MNVIKISKQFNVSELKPNNDTMWKSIHDYVIRNYPEEKVELDFGGVNVYDICINEYFVNLVKRPNIHFKVYFRPDIVKAFEVICIMSIPPLEPNRITNYHHVIAQPTETVNIHKVLYTKMCESGKVEKDSIYVKYPFSNITSELIIDTIKHYIDTNISEETKKITIDLNNSQIHDLMVPVMQQLLVDYKEKYNAEIINATSKDLFNMYQKFGTKLDTDKMSTVERRDILKEELPVNAIVLLTEYKKPKDKDKNKPKDKTKEVLKRDRKWTRYARVDAITDTEVLLTTFRAETFHTKEHLRQTSKDDRVLVFKPEEITVAISEVGFWDVFLGSNYHINFAVQFKLEISEPEYIKFEEEVYMEYEDDYYDDYEEDEEEDVTAIRLAMPDMIEEVLTSHGVVYNKEHLEECREVTYQRLGLSDKFDLERKLTVQESTNKRK